MSRYIPTLILITVAIIFHSILWSRRRTIATVIAIAELWQLATDPIGAIWGAWRINQGQVLGIWLYGVGITPIDNLLGIALVSTAHAVTLLTSATACAVLVFGYGPRRWI